MEHELILDTPALKKPNVFFYAGVIMQFQNWVSPISVTNLNNQLGILCIKLFKMKFLLNLKYNLK